MKKASNFVMKIVKDSLEMNGGFMNEPYKHL